MSFTGRLKASNQVLLVRVLPGVGGVEAELTLCTLLNKVQNVSLTLPAASILPYPVTFLFCSAHSTASACGYSWSVLCWKMGA